MSRPRFMADHDLNEHIVSGVLRREPLIEFVRARGLGLDARPDAEVLERAARDGLIVVSHDVNTMTAEAYARIRAGTGMAGLLIVDQTKEVAIMIESLIMIWSASEAEEWRETVDYLPV